MTRPRSEVLTPCPSRHNILLNKELPIPNLEFLHQGTDYLLRNSLFLGETPLIPTLIKLLVRHVEENHQIRFLCLQSQEEVVACHLGRRWQIGRLTTECRSCNCRIRYRRRRAVVTGPRDSPTAPRSRDIRHDALVGADIRALRRASNQTSRVHALRRSDDLQGIALITEIVQMVQCSRLVHRFGGGGGRAATSGSERRLLMA